MTRKSKHVKKTKRASIQTLPVDRYFNIMQQQMVQGNYAEAVVTGERLLSYLPQQVPQRVAILTQLGTAQAMLQNFPQSYAVLTEALTLAPKNADLWYNRSITSRFLSRFGQALQDVQRAIELNTRSELTEKLSQERQFCRKMVEESTKLRGPHFTLNQLIEQENLFQSGLGFMKAEKWEEAGQAFQASIDMGDCLPQPWGNLGICLMMQERYDEAETALKRALVIDPTYTLATNHLTSLSESRRTGPPAFVMLNEPYKHSKLKQSITFLKEE